MDKIHSNEREDFHLITFLFVDTSLFVRAYPVSAGTAAQWLTILLAELWPSPTKLAGLFFSLLSPSSVLRNPHFATCQLGQGQHFGSEPYCDFEALCQLPHVILGCKLGLVHIQVKPEALLQMCQPCSSSYVSIRVWNNNWSFGFVPSEYWEHLSQRTRTNLVQSKKCKGFME